MQGELGFSVGSLFTNIGKALSSETFQTLLPIYTTGQKYKYDTEMAKLRAGQAQQAGYSTQQAGYSTQQAGYSVGDTTLTTLLPMIVIGGVVIYIITRDNKKR